MSKQRPSIPEGALARRDKAMAEQRTAVEQHVVAIQSAEEALTRSYAVLFSGDHGRMIIADLIDRFGLTERVFIRDGAGDVSETKAQIRDGERAAVNYILKRAGFRLTLAKTEPTINADGTVRIWLKEPDIASKNTNTNGQ